MKYKMTIKKHKSRYSVRLYYKYELYEQKKFLWINYWSCVYSTLYDNIEANIDDLITTYNILCKIKSDRKVDDARFPLEVIKECE